MICHTAETHCRGPAGQGTQIGKRSHRMDVRSFSIYKALAALSNLVFIIYPKEICDIGC